MAHTNAYTVLMENQRQKTLICSAKKQKNCGAWILIKHKFNFNFTQTHTCLSFPKTTLMKREFQIYKEGTTNGKVTIMSKEGEWFDREAKIKKYIWLGYTVYDMNDKQITL